MTRIPPDQQAEELRLRHAAYFSTSNRPKPGDVVRAKRGFSALEPEDRSRYPMILWRMLDANEFADRETIRDTIRHNHVSAVDCIVAMIADEIDCIVFRTHDSALLERVP